MFKSGLIIGIAVALIGFIAQPTFADDDDDDDGGGGDNGQPEPGSLAVFRDANDKLVGVPLHISDGNNFCCGFVLMIVGDDTFVARVSSTSPDGFLLNEGVQFLEPGCDSDPYIFLNTFYGIQRATISGGLAYLPDDPDAVPAPIVRESELLPDGSCVNLTSGSNGILARTLILDFQGPFSLVAEP